MCNSALSGPDIGLIGFRSVVPESFAKGSSVQSPREIHRRIRYTALYIETFLT